jgi:acyl-CoA synthetase (AMP-forming)/AMP-acid ligase II
MAIPGEPFAIPLPPASREYWARGANASLTAVAGVAALAYLNAKYSLYKDISAIVKQKSAETAFASAVAAKRASPFYLFEASVQAHAEEQCVWSREGVYTFREFYDRVLQWGQYFIAQGVQPGDIVGLYMQNSPEFMMIWFGLWSVGAAPGMVNWNLADDALVHCVKLASAKMLLVDDEEGCWARAEAQRERLAEAGISLVRVNAGLREKITGLRIVRPGDELRAHIGAQSPAALIYTRYLPLPHPLASMISTDRRLYSGTTGLPKAYPFEMARVFYLAYSHYPFMSPNDIWYNCMPLYHGTGGVAAVVTIASGYGLAIGKKFSLRNFWREIHDSRATIFSYVGEINRYLLAAPPSPLDKGHNVRCIYGNGMRPDVWERFQERFAIPEVCEFFTSTEGMFAVAIYTRSGYGNATVGHQGLLMRKVFDKIYVPVATDPNTDDMYRDPATGFAKRLTYDEGGEIIVKVDDKKMWPGYWRSEAATNKKWITDVFAKGDLYYRPGDALRRDADGMWFFKDRLGDTFRWKSENVSTAEVSETLGKFPGILEANVYGVTVPGYEGRAGCAAVSLPPLEKARFDWAALARYAREKLPRYAVPVFVRVLEDEVGGLATHNGKQNKVGLRLEGVDPSLRGSKVPSGRADRFFWLRPDGDRYEPFEEVHYRQIASGQAKL